MKNKIEKLLITVCFTLLSACGHNTHLTPSQVTYQVKSNEQLSGYANNISRGFSNGTKSSKGFMNSMYESPSSNISENPYSNRWIMRHQIESEVRDCEQYASSFQTCADADKMISALAQCLNTVMNYKNPLMTHSYNNLDNQGQQYWAYLLNWRKSNTLSNFNANEFNILSQFAGTGYLTQSY